MSADENDRSEGGGPARGQHDTEVAPSASRAPTRRAVSDTTRIPSGREIATIRIASQPLPEASRETPSPVSLSVPGKALDDGSPRYESRARLGRGGMGEVQLCMDRRIGREVAMKLIRADVLGDDLVRARFEREARVQGQLEHPSVVPVYDLGVDSEGRLFFTMKRVRGRTVADIVDRQRERHAPTLEAFSRRRMLTAFSQLCLGVAFAHSRGVLHRDLKPDNVMIGDFGEVHLIDWGIATVLADLGATDERGQRGTIDADIDAVHKTTEGEAMGTPGYMAPEQVLGDPSLVDERADVFALGSILFEILTLEPLIPFGAIEEMHARTLQGVDARCSRFPHAEVPPELEEICLRATAPRDERYRTARELHRALEGYLDGDRDLAQRQALAAASIERAEADVPRALEGDDAARARALKELATALALSPANPRAAGLLGSLLLQGPRQMPAAARAAFAESRQRGRPSMRLTVFFATLAYPVVVLLLGLLGVRDVQLYVVMLLASVLCAGVAGWSLKLRDDEKSPYVLLTTTMLAIGTFVLIAGPVVMVPSVAGAVTVTFVSLGGDRLRKPAIGLGLAVIVLPLLAELSGLVPSAYRFDASGMTVLPRVTDLPAWSTLLFLGLTAVATVVLPVILVVRTQRFLRELEERTFLYAWNLRNMVPEGTQLPPLVPTGRRRRIR